MKPATLPDLTKSRVGAVACGLLIPGLALASPLPGAPDVPGALAVEALTGTPAATPPCTMDRPGRLRGRIFGALELEMDWTGPQLHCDGMPRPGGDGLRLFFSHPLAGDSQLALVLGIDGEITVPGVREWPVTVTVIVEGRAQFFSSAGQERCWARIDAIEDLGDDSGGRRLDGMVFCVGSLPSLGDLSSVTLPELEFSGRIRDDD